MGVGFVEQDRSLSAAESRGPGWLANCWYETWLMLTQFMLSPSWRMDLPSGRKDLTRIPKELFDYNNRFPTVSNGGDEF